MKSVADSVTSLMLREVQALRRELEAFEDESAIWTIPKGAPNSAGTLTLHLAGNLRHFVGARLGKSSYVRDRTREFEARHVPRAVLLAELLEAEQVVRSVLPTLTSADLAESFPETVGNQVIETGDFLLHLVAHLAYHLGQIDYHRRVVTGDAKGVGALPLSALSTARSGS